MLFAGIIKLWSLLLVLITCEGLPEKCPRNGDSSGGLHAVNQPDKTNKYSRENNVGISEEYAKHFDEEISDKDKHMRAQIIEQIRDKIRVKHEQQKTGEQEIIPEWRGLQIHKVEGIRVGHIQEVEIMPGMRRQIKTLSMTPTIFEIPDFLDEDESDFIIAMADNKEMSKKLQNVDNSGITYSDPERTFKAWDFNEDGFINAEEIVLLPGKIDLIFTEDDARIMIEKLDIDKDKNGMIDLEEFRNTDLEQIREYIETLVVDGSPMRNSTSHISWLWQDQDELLRYDDQILQGWHKRFQSITKLPSEIIAESEPMQVQQFDEGSYHQCRMDSEATFQKTDCCQYGDTKECRICRFLTVSIFLNDVEEGGEMTFPLANSPYDEDIMLNSGNWSGYFSYDKTKGGKNRFDIDMQFKMDGANKVFHGTGKDELGVFEFTDSVIIGQDIKFRKKYIDEEGEGIQYSGTITGGSQIDGKWWIPGQNKIHGEFFMFNKGYEKWATKSMAKCNLKEYCPTTGLVVKPKRGKAIMWYNHMTTPKTHWVGALDNSMIHGDCDVIKGDKWVANTWINVIGDGNKTLKAWKQGNNWLHIHRRNKYTNILDHMKVTTPRHRSIQLDINEEFKKDLKDEFTKLPARDAPPEVNEAEIRIQKVLGAVQNLVGALDKDGLKVVSKVVDIKLNMMCIPLVTTSNGQISLIDGSKE